MDVTRRRAASFLGTVLVAGVAGCTGFDSGTDTVTTTMPTQTPPGGSNGELDLREANVTAVELDRLDGSYRFDVTLYHNDDGEEGYADWWQVETLDGDRLGRRDLLHPHSTAPFTRSETIDIPDDVSCVVVRGHDQTHGYGGQAMLVNLETGSTKALDQGRDQRSFDEEECP